MKQDENVSGLQSVQLALSVLEGVAANPDGIGVSELAVSLGTTKGTVFRHLQTLLKSGYVAQDPLSSRYSLGFRAQLLAQIATRVDIRATAENEARQLRDDIGETTVVSFVTATALVVGITALGLSPIEIGVKPGSELPLHTTAQGKVALAFSRHPLLDRVVRYGLQQHAERTITDPTRLREEIDEVRRAGFAIALDEEATGVRAIAAPIFDATGDAVATIALLGLATAIRNPPDPHQLDALLQAAQRISRAIGYRPIAEPDLNLLGPSS
jgi:IclR family KDG regulon transcriptional repressor